ncbi:MAG: T9SS type A sorting domain-containing protein [Bacteroidota bacterium]
MRAVLVPGVGTVSVDATYTHIQAQPRAIRDTLSIRLIGADVGGVLYGDIQPVASGEATSSSVPAIRLGPNPADEFITVWISKERQEQDIELTISDVLGRAIQTTRTRAGEPIRLDTSGLPSGVYILSAEANRQRVQTRLVVARK